MPPFQNTSRIRARPSLSGSRPANPLTPLASENPRKPIQPGEARKPPDRQAGTGIGTWITLLLACLLIFNHFGRPFEKVLIGYRIPAVLCGTVIVVLILQRNLGGFVTRIGVAMVVFMAWMVLVTPLSSWRGGSLTYVGWYLALNGVLFVILTAVAGVGYSGTKKLFYVAAFSCFFHIIVGGRFDTDRLNLQGTFGNSDDVALLAGFAIPFTVFAALQLPQFLLRILVAVPATGFLLYFIGLTGTRAAIIGLGCIVAVYLWRGGAMQRLAIVAISLVALLGMVIVLPGSVLNRFATITKSFDIDAARAQHAESEAMASVAERYDLLMDGVTMTLTHPVWGVGPGQYPYYRFTHLKHPNGRSKIWFPSHNTYIQISSESGIPGLLFYLLFLAMIYKTIRNCYALNKPNSHPNWKVGYQMTLCLEAGFVYFVICAMFMTCDQHPHQFLVAGLAIAVEQISTSAISRQAAAALTASSPASGLRSLARPRFAV